MRSADIRRQLITERDQAIELLVDAQARLGVVQPELIREPILWGLRAAVELCQRHQSLLGLSIEQQLALARAIVAASGGEGT